MPQFMTDCPGCGEQIELVPHETKRGRYVGFCGCQGSARSMIETCTPEEAPRPAKRPTRVKSKAATE